MCGNKRFLHCLFLFLICGLILSLDSKETEGKTENGRDGDSYIVFVTDDQGLFAFDSVNIPLSEVLRELNRKTGAEFVLKDTSISSDLLSVSFSSLTFEDAIARVLKKYSYIVEYDENEHISVTILASKESHEASQATAKQYATYAKITGKEAKGTFMTAQAPPSNECEALWFADKEDSSVHFRGNPEDSELYSADEVIMRARKVLGMAQCSHLWESVIAGLSGIRDERAADLLAEIAEKGETPSLRGKATEALWHKTAQSEFKNLKEISILEKLSGSADESVSIYAKYALEDYNHYIGGTQSQSSAEEQRHGGEKVD